MSLALPFPKDRITSNYGPRVGGFHDGTDFGEMSVGTPIPASGDGVVHSITYTERGGNRVGIQYNAAGGTFLYCHLNDIRVRVGDKVRLGTVLGTIGYTGNVFPPGPAGAHLHLSHYTSGSAHQSPLLTMTGSPATAGASSPSTFVGRNITKRSVKSIQQVVGAKQDGTYGAETTAKVKAWQKKNGLADDGIWGPKSDAKAFGKPKPKPVVRKTIRRGSRGKDVEDLQSRLKSNYALYAGKLAVDGVFGPKTEAAVLEFQRRADLVRDGIVGPKTWARLGL